MIRYHARWLFPVSALPIEHGTVVVHGARIAWVGPRAAAPAGLDAELGDVVLMPGLVDAHCRLERGATRDVLESAAGQGRAPAPEWSHDAAPPDETLLRAARNGVLEGLRNGVTTFADTGTSDAGMRAIAELGVRGIAFQELVAPTPAERGEAMTRLRRRIDGLRPLETRLVRLGVAPHSVYAVDEEILVDACALALAERMPLSIGVAASDAEIAFIREAEGPYADALRARGVDVVRRSWSPVHLLKELGVADVASPTLVHGVKLDESDVAFVAASGCSVVLCPSESARLGAGTAPLLELLASGVAVGLGSGSRRGGERMDVLAEARLALAQHSLHAGRPHGLSGPAALELATRGGARALRLDALVGTLEPGKDADLAAFPIDARLSSTTRDLALDLLRALAGVPASFVAVAGEPLVVEGRVAASG